MFFFLVVAFPLTSLTSMYLQDLQGQIQRGRVHVHIHWTLPWPKCQRREGQEAAQQVPHSQYLPTQEVQCVGGIDYLSVIFLSQCAPLEIVGEPSILHFALCLERSEPMFDLFAFFFFFLTRFFDLHSFTFSHLFSFSHFLIFSFPRAAWAAVIEHRPSWVHVCLA